MARLRSEDALVLPTHCSGLPTNAGYNIYNKKALNVLPLPWLVGLVQLSIGLSYVFPLWLTGIRKVGGFVSPGFKR
jgi:hypothetical protein